MSFQTTSGRERKKLLLELKFLFFLLRMKLGERRREREGEREKSEKFCDRKNSNLFSWKKPQVVECCVVHEIKSNDHR